MKIRTDFVTNSSSSSFILARKPELSERQKEALLEYVERTFLGKVIIHPEATKEEIENAFEEDEKFEYYDRLRDETLKSIDNGLSIYYGEIIFDEVEYYFTKIFEDIWRIMADNADEEHAFVALNDDLSY